nr:GntR family transcriptional regulator [Microbacterium bovistercoris]
MSTSHRMGFGRAADEVTRILQGRIVDGTMPPGSRIDIDAITLEFGISRTPVREAVLQLEGLGLVERQPYRGAIVAAVDPDRFAEVTALRIEIEGLAAGLGAVRLSDDDLAQMRSILTEIEARGQDEDFALGTFNELNRQFHSLIAHASDSPVLIRLVDLLGAEADRMRLHSRFDHTASAPDHRAILDACERHDGPAARDLMRRHILAAHSYTADGADGGTGLLADVLAETGLSIDGVPK